MARKKTHDPLNVLINGRLVGQLEKAPGGAIAFQYDPNWLDWEHRFAISLSLPLRPNAYRGSAVVAVFDNLLPDLDGVRRRVAERMGAGGSDVFSLLHAIGRDCVGAMQFLSGDAHVDAEGVVGDKLSDKDIEAILAELSFAPLGLNRDQAFRISVAGAQEKTALLRVGDAWYRPHGSTPTTHILKPQLGQIPSADGMIDMSDSVDNEQFCLRLLAAFGLPVAQTEIVQFGARRVLVVKRFDRHWRSDTQILRLPQEDMCQALGVAPTQKYQSDGGPGMRDILTLLKGADDPEGDQILFFKSQILFWLIGASDGHAKNFSVFLKPGGRFSLTPLYDVLSIQPAVDKGQIAINRFRLAMSAGKNRHYRVAEVMGRHFVQSGKAAGLANAAMRRAIEDIIDRAEIALDIARAEMPADFADGIYGSVAAAITKRLPQLRNALDPDPEA